MARSHLETYIEIISLLEQKGPSNPLDIMSMTNLNSFVMKEKLGFLVKQGLMEEQTFGKGGTFFAVTQKDLIVGKCFQGQENTPLIVKEAQTMLYPFRNASFLQFNIRSTVFRN